MSVVLSLLAGLVIGYLMGWMSSRKRKEDDQSWPSL